MFKRLDSRLKLSSEFKAWVNPYKLSKKDNKFKDNIINTYKYISSKKFS